MADHIVARVDEFPEGARRMGQAGRDWVLTRFDLDRQVAATAHVYRSLARRQAERLVA